MGIEDKSGRGLRSSQTSLSVDAALSGKGIAMVSRFLVERGIAAGNLMEIPTSGIDGGTDFYLLYVRRPKPGIATEFIIKWLTSHSTTARDPS